MEEQGLRLAVIISDGIRGHVNQSRGVTSWLSKLKGTEVLELEIPKLKGIQRWRARRRAARLAGGSRETALKWLDFAGGNALAQQIDQWILKRGIRERKTPAAIFISAGSMPAFYNLALGRITGCPCAAIMTPSVTGTAPFDFAIVPEHDYPVKAPNVLTTLGAPNLVAREELVSLGQALLRDHPPKYGRRWGILIGGDDKNYKITAEWIRATIGDIFRETERVGADLYITTSRRTSPEAEDALKSLASGRENVRFLLIASADPLNPVPAMLGACDEIFVTDDSVNMVSEAATAGHRAVLLLTERTGALKKILQAATLALVLRGLLPPKALWGAPRFDTVFASFRDMGLLVDFDVWKRERHDGEKHEPTAVDFNEAQRSAEWLLGKI